MKNISIKKLLIPFLCSFALFFISSCGKDKNSEDSQITTNENSTQSDEITEGQITISDDNVNIGLYEIYKLSAILIDVEGDIIWESNNPSVATVDKDGYVEAISYGDAIITAKINNLTASCNIKVSEIGKIPVLNLNIDDLTLKIGNNFSLDPSLKIQDRILGANFEYVSANPNIVSVNEFGFIETKSIGTSIISITASYLEYTTTKNLEVKVIPDITVDAGVHEINLYTFEAPGFNTTRDIDVLVSEANKPIENPVLSWQSEDTEIATVNDGHISAISPGETYISAIYNKDNTDFEIRIKVIVNKTLLDVDVLDNIVDLKADIEKMIDINSDSFGEDVNNLVKIKNKSNHNLEISHQIVDGKIQIDRDGVFIGVNNLTFEFSKVIYNTNIKFTCDRVTLLDYESSADAGKVSIYWGDNMSVSYSEDVKFEDEVGSLKVTINNVQSWNYLFYEALKMEDVSDFDYIAFNVYNPTDKSLAITLLWCGDVSIKPNGWTLVKFPKKLFYMGNGVLNMNEDKISPTNIAGIPIVMYVDQLSIGESFYFSSLYASKNVIEPGRENIIAPFDREVSGINISSNHANYEYTDKVAYPGEDGSLDITLKTTGEVYITLNSPQISDVTSYDYISFNIYNPTDTEFMGGVLWACDTLCKPHTWTEIRAPITGFVDNKYHRINGTIITTPDNIVGFALRLMSLSNMNIGDHIYISSVKVNKYSQDATDGKIMIFDDQTDFSNLSSYNATIKCEVVDETSALKVTLTAEGEAYIAINNPRVRDISGYNNVSFKVYNPNDYDVICGVTWACDATCKAHEWTTITVPNSLFGENGTIDQYPSGADVLLTNVSGLTLRVMSGLNVGDYVYFTDIEANKE